MTPAGLRLLQDLRCTLLHPPQQLRTPHTDAPEPNETVGAVA
jgi:putative transposase